MSTLISRTIPAEIEQGLIQLVYPPFHESNLFDALADAIDRMRGVKGKKSILVLASGIDTFSRLTLDKVLPKVKGDRYHHQLRGGWPSR